jgi:hypothetical protein
MFLAAMERSPQRLPTIHLIITNGQVGQSLAGALIILQPRFPAVPEMSLCMLLDQIMLCGKRRMQWGTNRGLALEVILITAQRVALCCPQGKMYLLQITLPAKYIKNIGIMVRGQGGLALVVPIALQRIRGLGRAAMRAAKKRYLCKVTMAIRGGDTGMVALGVRGLLLGGHK